LQRANAFVYGPLRDGAKPTDVDENAFKGLYRQQDLKNVVGDQTAHNHKKTNQGAYALQSFLNRLIYAAKNFPEIGWLEILSKEEGKEVRETCLVYERLERAFQRIRAREFPPDFPSDIKTERSARRKNWPLDSRFETGQIAG
jgi:hypothetical protein